MKQAERHSVSKHLELIVTQKGWEAECYNKWAPVELNSVMVNWSLPFIQEIEKAGLSDINIEFYKILKEK